MEMNVTKIALFQMGEESFPKRSLQSTVSLPGVAWEPAARTPARCGSRVSFGMLWLVCSYSLLISRWNSRLLIILRGYEWKRPFRNVEAFLTLLDFSF